MNGPKLSTKSPIKLLAAWLALVFVCCTIMPLVYFVPKKTTIKNPNAATEIEFMGKKLADEVFAEPTAELDAEQAIVAQKIESSTSISTAFAADFDSYLVKVTSTDSSGNETQTVTGVNSLESPSDVSGSGTEADPYVVYTLRGWLWITNKIQYGIGEYTYINLGADIDFDGYVFDVVNPEIACGFVGVLDGCGYALKSIIAASPIFYGIGATDYDELIETENANEVKNLAVQVVMIDAEFSDYQGVFGPMLYHTNILNCDFDVFSYDHEYTCATAQAGVGYNEIRNCHFNLRSRTRVVNMIGFLGGGEEAEIASQCIVDKCIFDINIRVEDATQDSVIVGELGGSGAIISNCKTYGYLLTMERRTIGVFVYYYPGNETDDSYIINCENNVTIASPRAAAPFVSGSYNGGTDHGFSKLCIQDCINRGDVYWTFNYDEYGKNNVVSDAYISGFVGEIDPEAEIEMTGCTNYGGLYGAPEMAGFVGWCEGTATIKDCINFGSINYHWQLLAGLAGIAIVGTNYSGEKSIYIDNCAFIGEVKNRQIRAGVSGDSDGYINSRFAGICAISSTDWATSQKLQCLKDIVIQNCYVDVSFTTAEWTVMAPIFCNTSPASFMDNSTILIDNNTVFVTALRSEMIFQIGADYSGHKASVTTVSNNYYEYNLSNMIQLEFYNAISSGEGCQQNIWNNQYVVNLEYSYDGIMDVWGQYFEEEDLGEDGIGFMLTFSLYDSKTDGAIYSIGNNSYSINIVMDDKMAGGDITKKINNDVGANNIAFDYTSNIEGDEDIKQYYHSDDSVEKFSADKWFYSPELNGGRPMLRQFFHVAKYYTGQDCLARFTELGYTQYVEEETTA